MKHFSILIPARSAAGHLAHSITELHGFLAERFAATDFEIILIPNPVDINHLERMPQSHRENHETCLQLQSMFPTSIKVAPHLSPRGKFAALKTGMEQVEGRWVFYTDADCPFDLSFIDSALDKLESGFHLVLGSRRLPGSCAIIPSDLHAKFFVRDILGRAFNLLSRIFLPQIEVRDSQAGFKALHADLAAIAFERMRCPGFFGDIELILTAQAIHARITEVPLILKVNDSKSSISFVKDAFKAIEWLWRIRKLDQAGHYRSAQQLRDFARIRYEQRPLRLVHNRR